MPPITRAGGNFHSDLGRENDARIRLLCHQKCQVFIRLDISQVYSLDSRVGLEGMNVSAAAVVKITQSARNFVISLIVKLSIEIE